MTRPRKLVRIFVGLLALLVVSLGLFSSPALSTQLPNTIKSNESSAIATLRQIAAAQVAFQLAADIDTDCDGVGEYGCFGELAGTQPMRVGWGSPGNCSPACGVYGVDELSPPLLRGPFGVVTVYRTVSYQGYVFQMWLPQPQIWGLVGGIAEDAGGGILAAPFPDPANGAKYWCCYAWPWAYGQTGRSAYCINQDGRVYRYSNRSVMPFDGRSNMPAFDEAFLVPLDMSSPIRIGIPGGAAGSRWTLVP